jgi:DNA-binding IclR family transcriptional regulator
MPRNESLQSLQRAARMLYAVAGAEDGRTIRQIAGDVGVKPNTAYRFLRTLESEGLICRREGPLRFMLGPAIGELQRLHDERRLLSIGTKVLRRASLAMPRGSFALLEYADSTACQLLRVESIRPGIVVKPRLFRMSEPFRKASFLLFLAYANENEFKEQLERHNFAEAGLRAWGSKRALLDYLAQVRRLGCSLPKCLDDSPSISCRMAYPVFNDGNEVIAAVAAYILGPSPERLRRELRTHCRKAATDLQAALFTSPLPAGGSTRLAAGRPTRASAD